MRRWLLNLVTIVSVLLSLGAMAMLVRSAYLTDSWELPPRLAPSFSAVTRTGLVNHRHVESTAGRVVWIDYVVWEQGLVPPVSYQAPKEPLSPGQRGRIDPWFRNGNPIGADHGRVPYVAEWYFGERRGRYFYLAVPWPTLVLAFAVPPVGRWLWSKRRRRASAGPAFPVVGAADEPLNATQAAG